MTKKFFLSFALYFGLYIGYAQDINRMNLWQDSLLKISTNSLANFSDAERIENNNKFVKALVSSLKEPNAFLFNFEKLNTISILNAPDRSFRLLSWYLPLADGTFLYYGAVQYRSEQLKLIPLLDKTFDIQNPHKDILPANKWYGARYYEIVPLNKNQYVLLGWKGHHVDYSQKVIEVLNILPDTGISFGSPVFSDETGVVRRIFSYTRQASMYLHYNDDKNQIEFDHITSTEPRMEGDYKFYGPDLTYDGYKLMNNRLELMENIEIKNKYNKNDNHYINPLQSPVKKSGFREKKPK